MRSYKSNLYVDTFVTTAFYCMYMCMNFAQTVAFYNCLYRYCYLQFVAVAFYCIYMCMNHRHRIDKYLDTLLANQPISDCEATDRCQKVAPQDGGLPELIVARSCLTNHSEAASL